MKSLIVVTFLSLFLAGCVSHLPSYDDGPGKKTELINKKVFGHGGPSGHGGHGGPSGK